MEITAISLWARDVLSVRFMHLHIGSMMEVSAYPSLPVSRPDKQKQEKKFRNCQIYPPQGPTFFDDQGDIGGTDIFNAFHQHLPGHLLICLLA